MSLDASVAPQTDVSPCEIHVDFQDDGEPSKAVSEPSALVREALQLPAAKESTVSEVSPIVTMNHGDGVGNVMHHLAVGVGNEIVEHPLALAGNAALGFGMGYATKVGLASQVWRRPTIAGLVVMGGVAAVDLISSAPGWFKSASIAGNTTGRSLEEVQAAEKHLQALGGGALELGVGGVAGGLAFKPNIAAATESMIGRSRAAIFGSGDKAAAGEAVVAGETSILSEKSLVSKELEGLAVEQLPTSETIGKQMGDRVSKLFGNRPIEEVVHDANYVRSPSSHELPIVTISAKDARVARLFEAEAVRDAQTNAARQFIQKIDGKLLTPEYVADGFTHYNQSTGLLSSQRVKTSIGNSNQYYNWEGRKLTEIYSLRRGEIDPVTVKVRDTEFFVTAPDGTEVPWKGTMSGEGIFTKAPEENFATPFGLARAMPLMRHAEAFENGKNYAAQIDSWATDPNKREFFNSSEPRQLVKLRDSSGDNYFRYDDQGNMTGWTFKSGGTAAPFELKVTADGVLIPHPDGGYVLWKGTLQNGVWRKHRSEKIHQPLSLMSHLYSH